MHCGKMADQIWMPFGIIGWTGPGMRQVVQFGDRSTAMGTFWSEFGAHHCNQWGLYSVHAIAPRCGPLPKLLWANLLLFRSAVKACISVAELSNRGNWKICSLIATCSMTLYDLIELSRV